MFAHTRLQVDTPTLLYHVGVGGGTYSEIEAAEKAGYRAENELFRSRWTLCPLQENIARADVAPE